LDRYYEREKVKTLAVVDKARELAVAQADIKIQESAFKAAEFEAQAIKEVGLAQAMVDKAKLAAKQSSMQIYMAEVQRDIATKMYEALPNFKVVMPTNYIAQGGEGKSAMVNNLDILTGFGALGMMNQMTKGSGVVAPDYRGPVTK
jgi:hypothetical protein